MPRWLAGQVHCPHCLAGVDLCVIYLAHGGSLLSSDSRLSVWGAGRGRELGAAVKSLVRSWGRLCVVVLGWVCESILGKGSQ